MNCEECGKRIGFLKGYIHPTMGKKHLVCSHCYDHVSDSVDRWRMFLLANSFKPVPTKNKPLIDLSKVKPNIKKYNHISKNV
jgi:hypothetical protein